LILCKSSLESLWKWKHQRCTHPSLPPTSKVLWRNRPLRPSSVSAGNRPSLGAVDKSSISNVPYWVENRLKLVAPVFLGRKYLLLRLPTLRWPTAILISKLPVAKLLAGLVFCWAVLSAVPGPPGTLQSRRVRFTLVCTEAGHSPHCQHFDRHVYFQQRTAIRVAFWYNRLMPTSFVLLFDGCFLLILRSIPIDFFRALSRTESVHTNHELGSMASSFHNLLSSFQPTLGSGLVFFFRIRQPQPVIWSKIRYVCIHPTRL